MEIARVVELYVADSAGAGGQIGSGYRLNDELVLTAAHVVAGLPLQPADAPVPDDVHAAAVCQARPLDEQAWTAAAVAWRDAAADVAVLRLASSAPPLPAASPAPRWGRVEGTDQVAVSALGFPWAQERSDQVRDTEHLFGFLAPGSSAKARQFAVTVLTSPPSERVGGSPWAGMSGAALFAGPFLVGVLVVDPARFGTDRVVAAPLAPLLADPDLASLLRTPTLTVAAVEPRPRLAVTTDVSVAVTSPYKASDEWLGQQQAARLLLPEYGIVPFLGRDQQLKTLEDWCLDRGNWSLRLLLGAGGSGKTRLAAEACMRLAGHGWQAGLADPDTPGGQSVLDFDRATLLVVDDADLNVFLLEALIRRIGYRPPDAPPVRLLLLARHTEVWWHRLNRNTDHLPEDRAAPSLELHEGELASAERNAHHRWAMATFARQMHAPTPSAELAEHLAPDLSDAAFANPLLVHMHALLTATGADVLTTGEAVRERILNAVLDRERARWEQTFPATVQISGEDTRQQTVTAATLLAPPDQPATTALLTVVDDLAEATTVQRRSVANWLHHRYPGAEPPWVAPLRPDLLTEQLLATCPELTDLVLTGYQRINGVSGRAQVEQLLTELTRAASRDRVREALDRLLTNRLPDLLDAAIADPAGRLPDLLDRAITTCPQPQQAADLVDRLPERSTGLAGLAVTLTTQAVDHHRQLATTAPDAHTPDLPRSLNMLAVRLADLGRPQEALAVNEEAVTAYRQLAADRPDTFTPELAMSLHNLAGRLTSLGHHHDALTAIEEAVTLRRQLAAADPDPFTRDLASSLTTETAILANVGRPQDALTAIEEAVTLRRKLADAYPDAFTLALADSLNNLANTLADLGRPQEALTPIEEAVTLRRKLADAYPDAFTPALAESLNNQGAALADLDRKQEALHAIEEAVTAYRSLAGVHRDAYTPALAQVLNNLSKPLAGLDRHEEALTAIEEAVTLRRQLAAAYPSAHTPALAQSLNNLALRLHDVGRHEEALTAIEEAVTLRRQLADAYPDAHTRDLATSLRHNGFVLNRLGRRRDALGVDGEAVSLFRTLYARQPERYRQALAAALHDFAIDLRSLHLGASANRAEREAAYLAQ